MGVVWCYGCCVVDLLCGGCSVVDLLCGGCCVLRGVVGVVWSVLWGGGVALCGGCCVV